MPAWRLTTTGEYQESDLPALLASVKPHVLWLPAQWPETYSYTLSAAIESGLPIVASRIGAFPERLAGRPMTWLVDPQAPAETWIDVCSTRCGRELARPRRALTRPRKPAADYYAEHYLRMPSVRSSRHLVDLRRDGRTSVVVIPERFSSGVLTPCAYIRLLQPLDHPAIGGDFDVVLADANEALNYRADIIVTQRYAVGDLDSVEALIGHCRRHGIALLYDLDDDLRQIPRDHPDAALLRPRRRLVSRLVRDADAVWVSTPALADALCGVRDDLRVVENGIDERLWLAAPSPIPPREGPVRVLFMGTMTHDADFAIVEDALARLKAVFGEFVSIDVLGISGKPTLPDWVNRISMPIHAASGYPGFVHWITQQHWDLGIAPLADTAFNRCKSALKTLDYAAMGLPILASDLPLYRSSPADGPAGWLVPDDTDAVVCRAGQAGARRYAASAACQPCTRRGRGGHAGGTGGPAAHSLAGIGAPHATLQAGIRGSSIAGITLRFLRATGDARSCSAASDRSSGGDTQMKARSLATFLALSGVAVLPACSMFGGPQAHTAAATSPSSAATTPNYNAGQASATGTQTSELSPGYDPQSATEPEAGRAVQGAS